MVAHQRSMKLGDLAGLSLAAQATFATAVSEVARNALQHGAEVCLTLGISCTDGPEQFIIARIRNLRKQLLEHKKAISTSIGQLVDDFRISESGKEAEVRLAVRFPVSQSLSETHLANWKTQFAAEVTPSPYEEIRVKHRQLQELANQLRLQERQYRSLAGSLPLMIFTASPEGQLQYVNERVINYTGLSMAMLNETRWHTVIHTADWDACREHWQEHRLTGKVFRHQVRLRNAETGAYVWHLITTTPIRNDQNAILCWSGFLVDIQAQQTADQVLTDHRELTETKQQLEQYQHELKMNIGELNRSNQELAEFAYMASHDLQEPLRKIQSFGTLLMEQFAADLHPKAQDMIHRMQGAAERMHTLIKDLLSYSRLNTHHHPFRPVQLTTLVGEVLNDMDGMVRDRHAHIQLHSLPTIRGNAQQLRQLFQNLLSNALKFTHPDQAPRVEISAQEVTIFDIPVPMRNRHPSYLAISVQDNGIGFDERYHDRIFQLFQRLHGRDQYSGTGIGLTICKKVAEMHGGTIAARSHPGQGATFTVYLPISVMV
ncbi:ATP-binding protein [Larkinella bovis]|uniref:histidine kinase n=1 Tax=Larkinella bovis TaxID=683041 RepID=A0ABW0IC20_9BACT